MMNPLDDESQDREEIELDEFIPSIMPRSHPEGIQIPEQSPGEIPRPHPEGIQIPEQSPEEIPRRRWPSPASSLDCNFVAVCSIVVCCGIVLPISALIYLLIDNHKKQLLNDMIHIKEHPQSAL